MLSFSAQVQFRIGIKWASKIQASLNCHKNSIQSNIPGAFMKNEHQSPKAEARILLFSDAVVFRMYIWRRGAHPFLNKRDGCSICQLQTNTNDLDKLCSWLSTRAPTTSHSKRNFLSKWLHIWHNSSIKDLIMQYEGTNNSHYLSVFENHLPVTIG